MYCCVAVFLFTRFCIYITLGTFFLINKKGFYFKMANAVEVVGDGFDCDDETTFLFTSESVGEGHPGAESTVLGSDRRSEFNRR